MPDVPSAGRPSSAPEADPVADAATLRAALLDGDERVFLALVALHHPVLARVARERLGPGAPAEAALHATWRAFLDGLGGPGDEPVRERLLALLAERLPEGRAPRGRAA